MRLTSIFFVLLLIALGAFSAAAQTPDAIRVTVPFAFTVNHVTMPAGDYRITRFVDNSGLLEIQNVETRQAQYFLPGKIGHSTAADQSSVEFHSAGNGYSLANVWWGGYDSGVQLQIPNEPVMTASAQTAR